MLKNKKITTDKATLLVVEVSEVTRNVVLFGDDEIGYYADGINKYTKLPKGNWQLLGRLPEITEEQVENVVDKHFMDGCRSYDLYRDYRLNSEDGRWIDDSFESIASLLQANEVYFDNPLGDFESFDKRVYNHTKERLTEWKEAQAKVWDKERTFLLTKVD